MKDKDYSRERRGLLRWLGAPRTTRPGYTLRLRKLHSTPSIQAATELHYCQRSEEWGKWLLESLRQRRQILMSGLRERIRSQSRDS
jgi:hypothetical protein